MQAKDVMTEDVVAVMEDTPIHEIVGMLLKHRISAAPVIDADRNVVGIVSEGDLLRPEGDRPIRAGRPWWLEAVFAGATVEFKKQDGRTAGSVMTRNVVAVDYDTPLNEIAALLERRHIKRAPVLRDGKLVGIVSRANLLHGLANSIIESHEPGAARDRQLRAAVLKALKDTAELNTILVTVTARNGDVRLWGVVENEDEVAAAERAAKAVAGVKSVQNNLGLGPVSGIPV